MLPSISVQHLRVGLLLSAIAVLLGFVMGAVFGVAEDGIKAGLLADAQGAAAEADVRPLADKSFSYLKRAHMHWGGIGTATLALTLLVALAGSPGRAAHWASSASGLGALTYPGAWLAAGFLAPGRGSTSAAKKLLEPWFTLSAALVLVGSIALVVLFAMTVFRKRAGD